MTTATESRWLSVRDAASYLGVSIATLRRWTDAGVIPHWRTVGNQRRFDRQVLARWLKERSR